MPGISTIKTNQIPVSLTESTPVSKTMITIILLFLFILTGIRPRYNLIPSFIISNKQYFSYGTKKEFKYVGTCVRTYVCMYVCMYVCIFYYILQHTPLLRVKLHALSILLNIMFHAPMERFQL